MDASVDSYIDAFIYFAKQLEEVLSGGAITDLMNRIQKLPVEAEGIKNSAGGDFDSLNPFQKAKALANLADNVLTIRKIPGLVVTTVDGFKNDLNELKAVIDDLKANKSKYLEDGKKC